MDAKAGQDTILHYCMQIRSWLEYGTPAMYMIQIHDNVVSKNNSRVFVIIKNIPDAVAGIPFYMPHLTLSAGEEFNWAMKTQTKVQWDSINSEDIRIRGIWCYTGGRVTPPPGA